MKKHIGWAVGAAALAMAVAGCGSQDVNLKTNGSASDTSGSNTKQGPDTSKWMTVDSSAKSVDLKLNAGVHNGYNFNGQAIGDMSITVPVGWKVKVDFTNEGTANNSAMIVTQDNLNKGTDFTPAFDGASTSQATDGLGQGKSESFSFTASKAGKYGIVSAVPGHYASGQWDTLVVSSSATKPLITAR